MAHSRKKLNLTGQRYGSLIVLEAAENMDGRTAWLCRCDCGGEAVVKTRDLRRGHKTNCGCAERNGLRLNYIDGTCVEMIRARTIRRNNTSGVSGVDWRPSKRMWRAAICFKGKRYYLGSYHQFEEAVHARLTAEEHLYGQFLKELEQTEG